MLTFFALLPTAIFIGPILYLVLREKRFNRQIGAISNLNDFPKTRKLFITLFALWEICQFAYFYYSFQQHLSQNLRFLAVGALLLGLIALPISSKNIKHVVLVGISFGLFWLMMFSVSRTTWATLILFSQLGCTGYLIYALNHKSRKIPYWLVETAVIILIGVWNLSVLK